MRILAIETSCDDTSVAVVDTAGSNSAPIFTVRACLVHSQAELHGAYGGVYPTLAKREHGRNVIPTLIAALKKAGLYNTTGGQGTVLPQDVTRILEREPELLSQFQDAIPSLQKPQIDAIAVTVGPGLPPALWVGVNAAQALALTWELPLLPANHMEGHLLSVLLPSTNTSPTQENQIPFPALGLLVSGGHTELVLIKAWGEYEIVGRTRDDAAGEAFDKAARLLGLPYPGGPALSVLAQSADEKIRPVVMPRPMLHTPDFDFSFSGLKTALLYATRNNPELTTHETTRAALAHEFEAAIVEVLAHKTARALDELGVHALIVGGGVIANNRLREALTTLTHSRSLPLYLPEKEYTGDNAAMIAAAGSLHSDVPVAPRLHAQGSLSL